MVLHVLEARVRRAAARRRRRRTGVEDVLGAALDGARCLVPFVGDAEAREVGYLVDGAEAVERRVGEVGD